MNGSEGGRDQEEARVRRRHGSDSGTGWRAALIRCGTGQRVALVRGRHGSEEGTCQSDKGYLLAPVRGRHRPEAHIKGRIKGRHDQMEDRGRGGKKETRARWSHE